MIKLYRIKGAGQLSRIDWVIGQFDHEQNALDEYNSEVRRSLSEGIDDGRPELEFINDLKHEAEFFLTEEEVTHSPERRDEAFETARRPLRRTTGSPL